MITPRVRTGGLHAAFAAHSERLSTGGQRLSSGVGRPAVMGESRTCPPKVADAPRLSIQAKISLGYDCLFVLSPSHPLPNVILVPPFLF